MSNNKPVSRGIIPKNKPLEEVFANFSPQEKAVVYVDGANFFYTSKDLNVVVDYNHFKNLLNRFMSVKALNYFVAVAPDSITIPETERVNSTITYLENNGWRIHRKIADTEKDEHGHYRIRKGNVDVDLAVTMVDEAHCSNGNIDHVILVSGDKDYEQAVKVLRRFARVTVISSESNLSRGLRLAADEVIYFEHIKQYIEHEVKPNGQKSIRQPYGKSATRQ